MPSLSSVLSYPRQVLRISNNGMVLDHIVYGIWPLGSETSNSFCEGYKLFLALFVPAGSLSRGTDREMNHFFLLLLLAAVPLFLAW